MSRRALEAENLNRIHPWVLLAWGVSMAGALLMLRHPLYIGLLLGCMGIIFQSSPSTRGKMNWRLWVRSYVLLAFLAVILQAFFSHRGFTLWFSFPNSWPLLGGPIYVEAFAYGLALALALVALFFLSYLISTLTPIRAILVLIPRLFGELTTLLLIAFQFLPRSLHMMQVIREAQISRGHRFRGLKTQLPLLSAALAQGLEQSLEIAEALEVRGLGFVSAKDEAFFTRCRLGAGLGLLIMALALGTDIFAPHLSRLATGTVMILGLILLIRSTRRWQNISAQSRRQSPLRALTRLEKSLMIASAGLLGVMLVWVFQPQGLPTYDPYIQGLRPPFHLSLFLLVSAYLPLTLGVRRSRRVFS